MNRRRFLSSILAGSGSILVLPSWALAGASAADVETCLNSFFDAIASRDVRALVGTLARDFRHEYVGAPVESLPCDSDRETYVKAIIQCFNLPNEREYSMRLHQGYEIRRISEDSWKAEAVSYTWVMKFCSDTGEQELIIEQTAAEVYFRAAEDSVTIARIVERL